MFYIKIYHRSVQKIMPSLRPIGWRERYGRRGERSSVAIAKRTDFRTARAWYHVEPREGASSGVSGKCRLRIEGSVIDFAIHSIAAIHTRQPSSSAARRKRCFDPD